MQYPPYVLSLKRICEMQYKVAYPISGYEKFYRNKLCFRILTFIFCSLLVPLDVWGDKSSSTISRQ